VTPRAQFSSRRRGAASFSTACRPPNGVAKLWNGVTGFDPPPLQCCHGPNCWPKPQGQQVVRGENLVTPRAQFSSPIAGGQRSIENDSTPAPRRRRQPVEWRHGFKIQTTDQQATRMDQHPIIHLDGPALTTQLIWPVARISGGPWCPEAKLAYCALGAIVSPPSEYLSKTLTY